MFDVEIANERFNKARANEMWARILSILNPNPEDHELLSLHDVRKALRPTSEDYRGYKTVSIDKIIGSEGRYRDFSRRYLPKREESRTRWTSIDRAHQRDIILPAVNLYEIAGYYFVRDGNHRVSVARSLGMEEIDADIVKLGTEIPLEENVTKSALKKQIIGYERKEFFKETDFNTLFPDLKLVFTETGRYNELIKHFESHHHHLKKKRPSISLKEAMWSWRKNIYEPITGIIKRERVLARFPNRTVDDLYMWIIKHGDELRERHGQEPPISDVVQDLSKKYGKGKFARGTQTLKRFLRSFKR